MKQNRLKKKGFCKQNQVNGSVTVVNTPKPQPIQQNLINNQGPYLSKMGNEVKTNFELMITNQRQEAEEEPLMLEIEQIENPQMEIQGIGNAINKVQARVTGNDSYPKNESLQVGNENLRERINSEDGSKNFVEGYAKSDKEEVVNGPNTAKIQPKARKWKLRARTSKAEK